jgi:hypothetical protein
VTNVELTRALEKGEIDNADFKHMHHLQVAWAYLSEADSVEDSVALMRTTLRKFAAAAGVPEKYHETITAFWMRILSVLRDADGERSLDDWVRANPSLLEKQFPLTYYTPKRLFSERARRLWLEPDLRPLPTNAFEFRSASPSRDASDRDLSERVA